MSKNSSNQKTRTGGLKNESTRQRWDLFHRAISHAKQSNVAALENSSDEHSNDEQKLAPRRTRLSSAAS